MVEIYFGNKFKERFDKIRDVMMKTKVRKQISKISDFPEIGKPMMYDKFGTREVYVSPYRLSYSYDKEKKILVFINLYHKDEQ